MSLRIVSTYTPLYPTSPYEGTVWTDPNTNITWTYVGFWLEEGQENDFSILVQNYGWKSLVNPDYWAA